MDKTEDSSGSARPGSAGGSGGVGRGGAGGGSTLNKGKGKRGEKGRMSTNFAGGQQSVSGGIGGGAGGAGAGDEGNNDGGEDGDEGVVYRWHVDSLMGGVGMDVLPVMEEGMGEVTTKRTFSVSLYSRD